jgi:hypothetical protein
VRQFCLLGPALGDYLVSCRGKDELLGDARGPISIADRNVDIESLDPGVDVFVIAFG